MNLILLVLALVVAAANADCEACINGWCHSRKMLIQGFEASDKMAIDRVNNILYVQITSTKDPIFLEDNLKIEVVRTENITAMAIDQETQVLYTADTQHKLYEHELGKIAVESNLTLFLEVEKMLFHNGHLYYLTKSWYDQVMLYARIPLWYLKEDYYITNFVVDKNDDIYFVANHTVYMMNQFNFGRPKEVTCGRKNFVLSTDKFGDVYIGDTTLNAIYKINNETGKLVLCAAYETGAVSEFVFDDSNNIVFHDSNEGTVNIWKSNSNRCRIGEPHAVYDINEVSDNITVLDLPAASQ